MQPSERILPVENDSKSYVVVRSSSIITTYQFTTHLHKANKSNAFQELVLTFSFRHFIKCILGWFVTINEASRTLQILGSNLETFLRIHPIGPLQTNYWHFALQKAMQKLISKSKVISRVPFHSSTRLQFVSWVG